jgi:uncharacterized membrane protein YagU involved in acid resistance
MQSLLSGAVAGLAATVPMTAAMKAMHRQLPAGERYPLPPRPITMRAAHKAGVDVGHDLDERQRTGLTLAAHFGYGTMVGALYGPVAPRGMGAAILGGVGYGLLVWAGSYLGLLPALGLLSPATRHPARRNALMIAAHVVWGAALGAVVSQLRSDDDD